MMRVQLVLVLPREAASVPLARHTVTTALRDAQVDPECLHEVQVALSEACTNVFRHAGHDRSYEVVINLDTDRLTIDVVDFGAGFEDHPASHVMAAANAESGRGLTLIRAFTDRAVFDSVTGQGASVHLIKELRWPPMVADAPARSSAEDTRGHGGLPRQEHPSRN